LHSAYTFITVPCQQQSQPHVHTFSL
jgi:hypothetical protein